MQVSPLVPLIGAAGPLAASLVRGASQAVRGFADLLQGVPSMDVRAESNATISAPFLTPAGGQVQHEALRRQMEELASNIQAQLLERLGAAGIALDRPLALQVDNHGWIREVANHPQQAAIETLLGSDEALGQDLQRLVSLAGMSSGPLSGKLDSLEVQLFDGQLSVVPSDKSWV